MNRRTMTACALALAFVAGSGKAALAQSSQEIKQREQLEAADRKAAAAAAEQRDRDAQRARDAQRPHQEPRTAPRQSNDNDRRDTDRRDNDRRNNDRREFNDNDRQVTRDWYRENQRRLGPGWRQRDRLSPSMQRRLRRGYRLDPQLRGRIHWLPPELSRRYGPAPRGYRYAIIGGNIVLLDDMYEVHDVFSLTLTF